MAVQTTYSETLAAGVPGFIVQADNKDLISRNVVDAALSFGKAVTQDGDGAVHPTTTGDTTVLGIAAWDRGVDPSHPDAYAINDSARIMIKGVILVTAGATVVAGDTVNVVVATGAFSNTGGVTFPQGAKYETGGGSGDLVKVRLF